MTRQALLALAALLVARPLAAQLPEAETAFGKGDYARARAAYERVLATDSLNRRALYRLAVLDGWDGKPVRALARLARLRRLEPRDEDIMVTQAQVLAWAGQMAASVALYDSVLARSPDRSDALAGRARTIAWRGDLDRAEALWRQALERHPDDADLLIGLAQTLFWKGQPGLAEAYAVRARALAPEDRSARDLERVLRAALRSQVATLVDGATDSDHNRFIAQDANVTGSLGVAVRGTLRAGWRHATLTDSAGDVVSSGTSYGADAYAIAALGQGATLRAGLGVRRVAPAGQSARMPMTAQLGLAFRPGRYTTVGLGYSRTPFDETVGLMRQNLTIDALDWSVDASPGAGWSLSAGGGGAWLSDGNARYSAVGAVLGRVAKGLQLGPFARVMGYRGPKAGFYFTPLRFSVVEGRAVYQWQRNRWGLRADGGVGSQQVQAFGSPAPHQTEWHGGISLSRGWGVDNEIALVGSITNSAAAATTGVVTGSFRYRTLGLRFRQGL